jgi:hypothetical protein
MQNAYYLIYEHTVPHFVTAVLVQYKTYDGVPMMQAELLQQIFMTVKASTTFLFCMLQNCLLFNLRITR